MMKTCFKCGAEKPLTDFYKHPKMPDGHVNKCKVCNKRDVRENRLKNVEYYRAYDNKRYSENHNGFRDRIYARTPEWRKANPEKYMAHTAVGNALRDGRLVRGVCAVCGDPKVHGHHHDYSKPLDVTWLCPAHHSQLHKSQDG